eukprot:3383643-Pyramimonas_sp.AAC.1
MLDEPACLAHQARDLLDHHRDIVTVHAIFLHGPIEYNGVQEILGNPRGHFGDLGITPSFLFRRRQTRA